MYQSRMTRDTLNKINAQYRLSQLVQSEYNEIPIERDSQIWKKEKGKGNLISKKSINNQQNAF